MNATLHYQTSKPKYRRRNRFSPPHAQSAGLFSYRTDVPSLHRSLGRCGASASCATHHHDHDHGLQSDASSHDHGSDQIISACCDVHYECRSSWGPIRRAVYSVLDNLGMLRYSHAVSHSLPAALASGLLLVVSFVTQWQEPACVLGMWNNVHSAFATASMGGSLLLSSIPAFADAVVKALDAQVDAHTLMALAGFSSFALALPLEGALLFFLFHLAHVLESRFVDNANYNLAGLMDSLPSTIRQVSRLQDGSIAWSTQRMVEAESVPVGSLIIVKPGEIMPLDGVVVDGTALVGQENITGESLPVLKRPGSTVYAGGNVYDGTLVISTSVAPTDTATARIARLTAQSVQNKAAVESLLSKIMSRWSQVLIGATVLTLLGLLAAGIPLFGKHGALYRALALLTAGAPCALVLVPLAFVCAMSVLSRAGVVVKGGNVLDKLAGVSFVALDKTGTLSEGRLRLHASVRLLSPDSGSAWASRRIALDAVAALSMMGTHPVCDAVLEAYGGSGPDGLRGNLPSVESFRLNPGAGMSGKVEGKWCLFGSEEHVQTCLSEQQREMVHDAAAKHGPGKICSVLVICKENSNGSQQLEPERIYLFMFSDTPKDDSSEGVQRIRDLCGGIGLYTGDNSASAQHLADLVGLQKSELHTELAPEDKSNMISELQGRGHKVLMVGDGLNDAPALAKADVSAAFSDSTDSSVANVADIVMLRASEGEVNTAGDVGRLAFLLHVAQRVRVNVLQNLFLALVSMVTAIVPSLLGMLPLWVAVLLHEGSTVLVALNSCRLLVMRP